MRKITIVAASAAAMLMPNAASAEIFYCVEDNKVGFSLKKGDFVETKFNTNRFTINIEDNRLHMTSKISPNPTTFECHLTYRIPNYLTCNGETETFLYNTLTGEFGRSFLLGAIDEKDGERDSVTVAVGRCDKF